VSNRDFVLIDSYDLEVISHSHRLSIQLLASYQDLFHNIIPATPAEIDPWFSDTGYLTEKTIDNRCRGGEVGSSTVFVSKYD